MPSNESPLDLAAMDARMDSIRLKQILGGTLTDRELMCLQIEQNGFGCGSCSTPTYRVDAQADPSPTAEI
jgi:hypothetical protein